MIYVALLRGINFSGRNKIVMSELKEMFEKLHLKNVTTYINSGNIIFESDSNHKELSEIIREEIYRNFNLDILVLIKSLEEIKLIINKIPKTWNSDKEQYSSIIFLSEGVDVKDIKKDYPLNKQIDQACYLEDAIIWTTLKKSYSKSGQVKIERSNIYKLVSVRNINTVKKVYQLMLDLEKES